MTMGMGERSQTSVKKSTMATLVMDQWNTLGTSTRAKSAPFLAPSAAWSRMSRVQPARQPTVMARSSRPFAAAICFVFLHRRPRSGRLSEHDSPLEPARTTRVH